MAILYHSAAGGTRLVAELLGELLCADNDVGVMDIYEAGAAEAAADTDFIVFCYPTYFIKPSPSMKEFIERLAPARRPLPAYLVTTYEFYTENSLLACALRLRDKGMIVTGSAAIRAPGSDLTCVFPDWMCPWLYRFERGLPEKLASIAHELRTRARRGVRERLPRFKWYTPAAHALQRAFLDGFFEWRDRIRILPDRCSDCGACVSGCPRRALVRNGVGIRHRPERCELCTRCIHRCPENAIVLSSLLKDNRRLDARLYARLKAGARTALRETR
jgi:ferredoxin